MFIVKLKTFLYVFFRTDDLLHTSVQHASFKLGRSGNFSYATSECVGGLLLWTGRLDTDTKLLTDFQSQKGF